MKTHKIAPEIKEQIINRIKNDGIIVSQASKDHGVSADTIYGWISKKVNRFKTLGELVYEIYHLIYVYNNTRIHTALKMSPVQFALKIKESYNI